MPRFINDVLNLRDMAILNIKCDDYYCIISGYKVWL